MHTPAMSALVLGRPTSREEAAAGGRRDEE
jgi:hypothetical protein